MICAIAANLDRLGKCKLLARRSAAAHTERTNTSKRRGSGIMRLRCGEVSHERSPTAAGLELGADVVRVHALLARAISFLVVERARLLVLQLSNALSVLLRRELLGVP